MAIIGVTISGENALKFLVKHNCPHQPGDLKTYILTCGGLSKEAFCRVKSDEMTPAYGLIAACHRGFRPSVIISETYVSVLPVSSLASGVLRKSSEMLVVGIKVSFHKIEGVIELHELKSQFSETKMADITKLLTEVLGFPVHPSIYIESP